MRIRIAALALAALSLGAVSAKAGDFETVVGQIERASHVEHRSIPLLGLGRLAVNIIHPDGVHDMRIAVFDSDTPVKVPADFLTSVEKSIGPEWSRMVVANSKKNDGEKTIIFAQPVGKLMRLLIVTIDDDDTAVVQVDVDPEHIDEFIKD